MDNEPANGRALDARLREYLLGRLTGPGRQEVEERLMTDDGIHSRLLMVEEELIDDYVRGVLPASEQDRFDQTFLTSPERMDKVRLAAALTRHASRRRPVASRSRESWWAALWRPLQALQLPALAVALLALVFGGWWMASRLQGIQRQLSASQESQAELRRSNRELQEELSRQRSRSSDLANQLAATRERADALQGEVGKRPSLLTVALRPGLLRGAGDVRRIRVPGGLGLVQLKLEVGEVEYSVYTARLTSASGEERVVLNGLPAKSGGGGAFVILNLASDALPTGDYTVRLEGSNSAGEAEFIDNFHFRVTIGN